VDHPENASLLRRDDVFFADDQVGRAARVCAGGNSQPTHIIGLIGVPLSTTTSRQKAARRNL